MKWQKEQRSRSGRRFVIRGDLFTIVFLTLLVAFLPFCLEDAHDGWENGADRDDSMYQVSGTDVPKHHGSASRPPWESAAERQGPVRFLHMNVKNYFVSGEPVRSRYKISVKEDKACHAVASVIASAKPDVVGVCEIGGRHALLDLKRRLAEQGMDYPYFSVLERPGEPRGMGVLSIFPIVRDASRSDVKLPGDRQNAMLRGILDVVIETDDGRKFRIIEVHLKSKFKEDSQTRSLRRREAMALRNHLDNIMEEEADMPVVVAGDFNDGTYEAAVYVTRGEKGSSLAMHLLKPVDSRGDTWTIYHDDGESYHAYDHMLINKVLQNRVGKKGKLGIVDIPGSRRASDHRALWVDLY